MTAAMSDNTTRWRLRCVRLGSRFCGQYFRVGNGARLRVRSWISRIASRSGRMRMFGICMNNPDVRELIWRNAFFGLIGSIGCNFIAAISIAVVVLSQYSPPAEQ
ncbi:hypothetical protein ABGV49_18550 [Chromobacterium vaccinii]|uniref:Uncharacterized protein n=1 Tax=Chromobacterium vaccinii TaxID=1108595 RepID=A0ABV0FIV0_9NEIS